MQCLACGDCCRRMSPISNPHPCPHLIWVGDIAGCLIYDERPPECAKHDFPANYCPVGMSVLKITTPEALSLRIDTVYHLRNPHMRNRPGEMCGCKYCAEGP